ncbi:sugar ABC transporter ATP-binding protein [Wukongibacter baidiensis]|uniref:sugar ABC transporter ATP-binding protein n=1 Tax=Wukongibacter baidiensis TaxID=1723361 RepID=UPI003D7F82E5
MSQYNNLLEMKNISKSFPGVRALKDVNFSMRSGTTHALIGANGAGKSTLMKVLAGAYGGDFEGKILIDDEEISINKPVDSRKQGIEIVHQEVDTALIPHLTVAENIMLDYTVNEYKKAFINWKDIKSKAKEVLKRLKLELNVDRIVSELSLSEKQLVLIGRAIAHDVKFIILDEPTAPLSLSETEQLFNIINDLKKEGVGIIFISHRLNELFRVCEDITVLKDGELVGTYKVSDMTIDSVIEKMLGRKMDETYPKIEAEIGDKIFEVKDLSGKGDVHIDDVNMHVRAGEIVGIAGLVGAGKTELSKLLFGASVIEKGSVLVNNKEVSLKTPKHAVDSGICLVPEERRKEGILVKESVACNITLGTLKNFCNYSFINNIKINNRTNQVIKDLGIKTPSEKQKVAHLSGGNQQKVAIGKWLISDSDVYIFDEPTKGVDVGAKSDIFILISELAKKGKGIIYASCELGEIMGISDRIYVMYDGKIAKELITKDTNQEEILYYSTGGQESESAKQKN